MRENSRPSRAIVRLKSLFHDAKTALGSSLEKTRAKRRSVDVLSDACVHFVRDRMYINAGLFAYNAFFSLFATLLLASAVLGTLLNSFPSLYDRIMNGVYSAIPNFGESLRNSLDAMTAHRHLVGVIGLVGLLWTGTRVFIVIERGLCQIWDCESRSFFQRRLVAVGLIAAVGLLFTAGISVHFGYSALLSLLAKDQGVLLALSISLLRLVLGLVIGYFLFLLIYAVVLTRKQSFRTTSWGAIAAAALTVVLQYALGFYFEKISRATLLYGAIAAFIGVLIWLHLVGLITFFGAEIAKAAEPR